jgi:hypothetical protein
VSCQCQVGVVGDEVQVLEPSVVKELEVRDDVE